MKKYFKKRGFTLVELLVVIAIIGILFVVLISKVDFATDKAKETGVKTDFRSFQLAFETLYLDSAEINEENINKNLDSTLKITFTGNTGISDAKDPWGNWYKVRIYPDTVTAMSYGADKKNSTPNYKLFVMKTGTYTEGFSSNIDNISESELSTLPDGATVTSVSVTNPVIGEKLAGDVIFSLSDTTTRTYSASSVTVTGYDKLAFDDQTITISKGELSGTATIKTQKHPEQTTSNLVAYGTDNKAVNLDLWEYCIISNIANGTVGTYCINDTQTSMTSGYKGLINDGVIQGTIPLKINNIDVTSIRSTFRFCTSLVKSPVIPSSVVNIQGVFIGCTSLTTATQIPNSVTNVMNAFSGCTSLVIAPTLPSSLINMVGTFSNCSSLTTAPTIPNSVINMQSSFSGCTSLKTAPTIPNSVTTLYNTFANCSSLTTAPTIPNSVTNFSYTFSGCTSLTTAPIIPSSVTDMNTAFSGCTLLKETPVIPNSVISIGDAFNGCVLLETAPLIPISVTNMVRAFYGCESLTGTLTINSNATQYSGCFEGASTKTGTNLVVTGTSTTLDSIIATKSVNSNITKKD